MSPFDHVSICPKLCCVAVQNPDGVPARDPDRLIKWFIGGVVMGVGVNLLGGFVGAQKWAWLLPAVFAAALSVAVPSTALLRRGSASSSHARGATFLPATGHPAVVAG